MTATARISAFPIWLRRIVASGGAMLVLFLAGLAASPDLHARFHGAAAVGNDEGCAVVLFANGVSLATGTIAVKAPELIWSESPASAAEKLFLVASRYLRQPERGPPLS